MKKLAIIAAMVIINTQWLQAQNEVDALRYSRLSVQGTARSVAMGSAFGALGGDFSTLSTNPAGIALYKKSELTFTPNIYSSNVSSSYNGTTNSDVKSNFNLSNTGMVFTFHTANTRFNDDLQTPQWMNVNFGFGYNRTNNFHNNYLMEGFNDKNSLMTQYLDWSQGLSVNELNGYDTKLAWEAWLMDTIRAGLYVADAESGGVTQYKSITTKGSMNEMVFNMGGNYNEQLYMGATFGIPFISYEEQSVFKESDAHDTIPILNYYTLGDYLRTEGTGVNFKFGMIYRINDFVRIGAAFHTPTFYEMHDSYSRQITTFYDSIYPNSDVKSKPGEFDYNITTPMRAIGSVAFLVGKMGCVSAEYEFVDYSEARLRSIDYKFFDENEAIQKKYTAAHNFRVGTEWNLLPVQLRGGFAYYGNPYKSNINDATKMVFSGGIGLRDKYYFLDFTGAYTMYDEDYYLYGPQYVNPVKNQFTSMSFLMTMGFRF